MMKKMKALLTEEKGQGMTEYALVLGVIAVAIVVVLGTLKDQIITMYKSVVTALGGTPT
jgi:pilus assembly protein Flp/PilA